VLDEAEVCRGLIAMNLQTLELKAFPADAVIVATGGPGLIYGKSTNSMVCTAAPCRLVTSRARSMLTASSFRCIRRQFLAKTSCA